MDQEQLITVMIEHMAKSHHELARMMESKRCETAQLSQIVHAMPDRDLTLNGVGQLTEYCIKITKNITAYLNSLADLGDALADNLTHVMGELSDRNEQPE